MSGSKNPEKSRAFRQFRHFRHFFAHDSLSARPRAQEGLAQDTEVSEASRRFVSTGCQPCQPCQPNFWSALASETERCELPAVGRIARGTRETKKSTAMKRSIGWSSRA